MELLARPVVVTLAVLGARLLNYAGYGFMGASMLPFALAGLHGAPA